MTAREITSVALVVLGGVLLIAAAALAWGLAAALAAAGASCVGVGVLLGLGEPTVIAP